MTKRMFWDIFIPLFGPGVEKTEKTHPRCNVKAPEDIYETNREKEWKLEESIHIKRILITISTWDKIPVKVGVCLDGKGVDAGSDGTDAVLACLTTPATGGGSSSIEVEVDAVIEKGRLVNAYIWAHNMQGKKNDLHAQVIIYYD